MHVGPHTYMRYGKGAPVFAVEMRSEHAYGEAEPAIPGRRMTVDGPLRKKENGHSPPGMAVCNRISVLRSLLLPAPAVAEEAS